MANEISVTVGLTVRKSSGAVELIRYNRSAGFRADLTGTKGPCVGAVDVPTSGKDIDLSQITEPGVAWFSNQDATNFVEYGIKDPQTNLFYPLGEIHPGESWPIRLSRNLQEQYAGSGTGTTGPENKLRFKANGATVKVLIEIFEK